MSSFTIVMTEKLNTSQMMYHTINRDTNLGKFDEYKTLEAENCCSNTPIYEISYNTISRKWLVCNNCLELEFFKTDIKEKVRIQT